MTGFSLGRGVLGGFWGEPALLLTGAAQRCWRPLPVWVTGVAGSQWWLLLRAARHLGGMWRRLGGQ